MKRLNRVTHPKPRILFDQFGAYLFSLARISTRARRRRLNGAMRTRSIAAVCRSELLSAMVFSRVAGAWQMIARVCYSSVYFSSQHAARRERLSEGFPGRVVVF